MPSDGQRYIALWNFEKAIDWGLFIGMKPYENKVLLLQIRHAQYPSGWVWVGSKTAQKKLGICPRDWYKSLWFLAENGYYKTWGKRNTYGQIALAFKLDLGVPKGRVAPPRLLTGRIYSRIDSKVKNPTILSLESYLTIKLGKPYYHVDIEKDITSINDINEGVSKRPEELKTEEKKKHEGPEPCFIRISKSLANEPAILDLINTHPQYLNEIKHLIKFSEGSAKGKDEIVRSIKNEIEGIAYRKIDLGCYTEVPPQLQAGV